MSTAAVLAAARWRPFARGVAAAGQAWKTFGASRWTRAGWLGTVASPFAAVDIVAAAKEATAGNDPAAGSPDGKVLLKFANNAPRSLLFTVPSPPKSPWAQLPGLLKYFSN